MTLTVALNADAADIPVGEKKTVGGAVGIMTNGASFVLYRRMLEDPRASLFGMTLETDVNIEFIPAPEVRPGARAMGRVAVRTQDCSLQHFVPGWKKEFELDFPMARETEVGFLGLEQLGDGRFCMHSMAISTAHGTQLVGPPLKLEEFLLFLVALEANV